MSNELNLCPFCGGEVETDDDDFRTFFCSKCGAGATFLKMFEDGEFRHATKEESVAAWNRRTPSDHIVDATKKADDNPPLTLDELRGMGDELVWVEDWYTEQPCKGCSGVARASDALTFANWRDTDYYGKWWLAYRRKPEEVAQ